MNTLNDEKKQIKNKLNYSGSTGNIYRIWLLNFFLKIITLGIYGFWGRSRMRQYITRRFSLENDNFEYLGTGKELFIGFLKCLPILIIIIVGINISLLNIIVVILISYLFYIAIYSAYRYRASRITWKSIQGRLSGSAITFTHLNIKRFFINLLTFSLAVPSSDIKIFKYIANNTYFGNTKLTVKETNHTLMRTHIITMLLIPFTFGISRNWYKAKLYRFYCESISLKTMHFQASHTGLSLTKLYLINILIRIFTLGLGTPFILQRKLRYIANNLTIIGELNTTEVSQSDAPPLKSGEGLIESLDLDLDFGLI